MARDYAARGVKQRIRRQQSNQWVRKSPATQWHWLGYGLLIGFFIALAAILYHRRHPSPQPTQKMAPVVEKTIYHPSTPQKVVTSAATKKMARSTQQTESEPQFSFYTLLPQTPTTAPTPTLPKHIPANERYYVQVAVLSRRIDAKQLAARLKQAGFPAQEASSLGDSRYRVQVGPYQHRLKADRALAKIAAHEHLKGIVITH